MQGAVETQSQEAVVTQSPESIAATKQNKKERRRVLINVFLVSFAFMLLFIAYKGIGNLQSSMNKSVGTAALATIYVSLTLSNLFLPVMVIRWLGCKTAIAMSFITYIPYVAAQFYPTYYTMIPAALLLGLGAGPLWCGKCTYLSVMADKYAELTGISSAVLTTRFFGIFFMIFQFSQVWGNLISSIVFAKAVSPDRDSMDLKEVCGANFCLFDKAQIDANNTHLERPSNEKVYIVTGIYLAAMASAIAVVMFFLDSLKKYGEADREIGGKKMTGMKLLAITVKLLKEPNQLLIIPMTMFMGIEQSFMSAEYNSAFVSCAWGIQYIGFVMITYGVANSVSAVFTGWLVKHTGRFPLVCGAFVVQMGVFATMLFWKPHSDQKAVFFLLAIVWGFCDGVWLVQINALCGIMFPGREEAAYSNFRMWESLGFIISYGYSSIICLAAKLYVVVVVLAVGMAGYVVLELKEMKKNKAKKVAP